MNELKSKKHNSPIKSKILHITIHIIISSLPFIVLIFGTTIGTIFESIQLSKINYVGIPASIIIFPVIALGIYTIICPTAMILQSVYCLLRFQSKMILKIAHSSTIVLNALCLSYFMMLVMSIEAATQNYNSSNFTETPVPFFVENTPPIVFGLLFFIPLFTMFIQLLILSLSNCNKKTALTTNNT